MRPEASCRAPHTGSDTDPERLLYASLEVRVGTFRCPPYDPGFRTAGAIEGYTVYFPRSAVWIEHLGATPFVADPGVVTIYNQGQPYVRHRLAADGDRGEWFSVGRELAFAIASSIDPNTNPDRPFPVAEAPSDPQLYRRQRRLVLALMGGLGRAAGGGKRGGAPDPGRSARSRLGQQTG